MSGIGIKRIIGPTILLVSGEYFDYENPEGSPFTIYDIAHALAKQCRFNGHCSEFYSVAQHSVLVSMLVPRQHRLAALLHDGNEAFMPDMNSPLKSLFPQYKLLEKRVQAAVFARFGLPTEQDPCIKVADLRMLRTEQRDLMNTHGEEWPMLNGFEPAPFPVLPLGESAAKELFLYRFGCLWAEAQGVEPDPFLPFNPEHFDELFKRFGGKAARQMRLMTEAERSASDIERDGEEMAAMKLAEVDPVDAPRAKCKQHAGMRFEGDCPELFCKGLTTDAAAPEYKPAHGGRNDGPPMPTPDNVLCMRGAFGRIA